MSRRTFVLAKKPIAVGLVAAIVVTLAAILASAAWAPPPVANVTAPEDVLCSLSDVGPGYVLNRTYEPVPSGRDRWVDGAAVVFDAADGQLIQVACGVFAYATTEDRDSDFLDRRAYAESEGGLVTPAPASIGDDSFFFSWTEGGQTLYGAYFVRGMLGILVNVAGPVDFPYTEYTSTLALRIASK